MPWAWFNDPYKGPENWCRAKIVKNHFLTLCLDNFWHGPFHRGPFCNLEDLITSRLTLDRAFCSIFSVTGSDKDGTEVSNKKGLHGIVLNDWNQGKRRQKSASNCSRKRIPSDHLCASKLARCGNDACLCRVGANETLKSCWSKQLWYLHYSPERKSMMRLEVKGGMQRAHPFAPANGTDSTERSLSAGLGSEQVGPPWASCLKRTRSKNHQHLQRLI